MDDPMNPGRRTCVVIGGRGFVGRWLVFRLLNSRGWIVRVADSLPSPQLDPSAELDSLLHRAVSSGLASYHHVDLLRRSSIFDAIEGSQVVFYTDLADLSHRDLYGTYQIIVQGAKNVVTVCRECKVKQLIYNSSADVVFDGSQDLVDEDESLSYPSKYQDTLSDLRAQAEATILLANDVDGLLTCSLRPSIIFGPGDDQYVPLLVKGARAGLTKFIIGDGENMSDFTYVENVAHANIFAEEALRTKMVSVAGKAFFITNNEPVKFWEFVTLILEGLGYERPSVRLPIKMIRYILLLHEWMSEKCGILKGIHCLSAHQIVHLASRTRTFDCYAARKRLGYSPAIPLTDSISRTVDSFGHLSRYSAYLDASDFPECSKAEKILGRGKIAKILLWRDEKTTFACFVISVLLFYWFFMSGRSFVSSMASLLLIVTAVLFAYVSLPLTQSGFALPQVNLNFSKADESLLRDSCRSILLFWNDGARITRELAKGEDWNTFCKVVFSLYSLKIILIHYVAFTAGVVLVSLFTFFLIYEQYESEIDAMAVSLICGARNLKWLLKNFPI
ncbi:hypothetical protein MLD38_038878 [Melastoma candidum]|uniref:Uncharacterized protein n=1 Tax=Melastoma candidum TaxID=119954 RepID=A0ACB9L0J7_9MYRT|nr:hypothetical protein MLD38_038878 [Melastoma candidum]